jgi:hypothetical protein
MQRQRRGHQGRGQQRFRKDSFHSFSPWNFYWFKTLYPRSGEKGGERGRKGGGGHAASGRSKSLKIAPGLTGFAGARFVDTKVASLDLFAVEGFDRFIGRIVVGHFDKAETLRAAGLSVVDNPRTAHFAKGFENFSQFTIVHSVRQVANVDVHSTSPNKKLIRHKI